jgi:hypothetical protein
MLKRLILTGKLMNTPRLAQLEPLISSADMFTEGVVVVPRIITVVI